MNYYKITIAKLIDNFYKERTYSHLNQYFFLISHLHFVITLEIAQANYQNKKISIEDLYSKIPKIFGSRSTIKKTLREGVNSKFFVKNTLLKDKRVKIYDLNANSRTNLELWLHNRKILYSS